MTDDREKRQKEIDAFLERYYARNPGVSREIKEATGTSPLDMGTVPLDEVSEATEFPSFEDMDFFHETAKILRKRLVWDIVPTTEQIKEWGPKMGVVPGSDEGDAIEEADHSVRYTRLLPILPLLALMAAEAGVVVTKARALADSDIEQPDGDVTVLKPEHDVIAEVRSGTLAVIANLLEMDVLTYGSAVIGE